MSSLGRSMKLAVAEVQGFSLIMALLLIPLSAAASGWSTIDLQARPLNITANGDVLWVCGADELIANSMDGGKTWNVRHLVKNGALLLAVGSAGGQTVYAAGTNGELIFSKDDGTTWMQMSTPSSIVYAAAFSDDRHGLIQTPHAIYQTSDGGASWKPVNIDLSTDDLKGFRWVRALASLDSNHMLIVVSDGDSQVDAYKLLVTKNGGEDWRLVSVSSTGLSSVTIYKGEYWAAGMEVIEKDKPGGGYGVPLVMRSADGETWTHFTKWAAKEFSECNSQSCLFGDGSGTDFRAASPQGYWKFPSEKAVSARWAVAQGSICSVGTKLQCATLVSAVAIPADAETPIPAVLSPPPLDAPDTRGPQCIDCDVERLVVTDDYQGIVDVDLKIGVGVNGLVNDVEVLHATRPQIGDRVASEVRNWIFVPYQENGAIHPVTMNVSLHIQAIRSN